jgi:hypothetical protein
MPSVIEKMIKTQDIKWNVEYERRGIHTRDMQICPRESKRNAGRLVLRVTARDLPASPSGGGNALRLS